MSAHRDNVREVVEGLHRPVVAALSFGVLQDLAAQGGGSMEIWPDQPADLSGGFAGFDPTVQEALRELVASRGIEDLREAEVSLQVSSSTRVLRCVAAGVSRSRDLQVLTVAGRSRIRTRWVHMWHDWKHTQEWPVADDRRND